MKTAQVFASATLLSLWMAGTVAAQQTLPQPIHYPERVVIQQAPAQPAQAPASKAAPADCVVVKDDCGRDHCFQLLKPWKCEDLEMKPVECKPKAHHCGLHGCLHDLLWCPCEEKKENGNGNGCEKQCNGPKVSGWIQGGYTYNLDGPNRGVAPLVGGVPLATAADGTPLPSSFLGPNFNNRSNDFMANQVWLRLEKALDHEKASWGYTIDVNYGQDAADFNVISIGMWENFTGDAAAVIADDEDYGLDIPQFFVETHIPGFITPKGMDIRVGRFFTLHGNELSPAIQTDFYSHSYGYFYSWPLTHTGVMTTLHLTDTVDLMNGIVLGWDNVFADNNDKLSWHGMVMWTACDKRSSFWLTWMAGPEGVGIYDSSNDHWRVLVTADYSQKFGRCDEWKMVLHGANAWDTSIFTGEDVEWYDYAVNLFYTVTPQLILGARAEYFRDDDGYRIGIADSYYEVTLGLTYKPFQNLRIRPEIRWDRAAHNPVFNDFADKEMFTAAVDVIWEF